MNPAPVPPVRSENAVSDTAWTLGWASLIALVVPPGLIVAPVCGLLATIFGGVSLARPDLEPSERERAMIGLALGVVTLVVTASLIYLFRHAIGRVLDDVNFG
jgi:hypothetical protein